MIPRVWITTRIFLGKIFSLQEELFYTFITQYPYHISVLLMCLCMVYSLLHEQQFEHVVSFLALCQCLAVHMVRNGACSPKKWSQNLRGRGVWRQQVAGLRWRIRGEHFWAGYREWGSPAVQPILGGWWAWGSPWRCHPFCPKSYEQDLMALAFSPQSFNETGSLLGSRLADVGNVWCLCICNVSSLPEWLVWGHFIKNVVA